METGIKQLTKYCVEKTIFTMTLWNIYNDVEADQIEASTSSHVFRFAIRLVSLP